MTAQDVVTNTKEFEYRGLMAQTWDLFRRD